MDKKVASVFSPFRCFGAERVTSKSDKMTGKLERGRGRNRKEERKGGIVSHAISLHRTQRRGGRRIGRKPDVYFNLLAAFTYTHYIVSSPILIVDETDVSSVILMEINILAPEKVNASFLCVSVEKRD